MDLSALIFVALAVAWAVYLIPKALTQHDEEQRSRTVETFSDSMRVLARREAVDSRSARLVITGEIPTVATREELQARRASAARAATRRLRVFSLLILGVVVVGVLAALSVIAPVWVAIPAGLVVVWLVLCRVMVRSERASYADLRGAWRDASVEGPPADASGTPSTPAVPDASDESDPVTDEISVVEAGQPVEADEVEAGGAAKGVLAVEDAAEAAPEGWDPVPTTLPTYVSKPAAPRRSVRTIDLDSTGIWSSGRKESDSVLAREAEAAERDAKSAEQAAEERRRASGS